MSSYVRNNPHSSGVQNNTTSSPNRSISPIHYVKPSSVYYTSTISPSKSLQTTAKKSVQPVRPNIEASPNKNLTLAQQDEVDLWKSRCNELETSLCQVNTDLELASFKAKKAKDLESKVDDILKQNAQLLGENDQLSKQFSQKRTESDIWKSKYDAQMNTILSLKDNYEREIKRLQNELSQSRELYDSLQQERLKEAQETKQQLIHDNLTQIESLKRSHCSNVTLYEEQLRKMRDNLEEREKENLILQGKLNDLKNYSESEQNRLNEDREKLRMKISQMELDQSKELENLKRRCDGLTLEQISALKKLHESELDVLESELNKLKNLLDIKNQEIGTLIQQNKSQKRNFDNELQSVRDENEALKDKILENNRCKEDEIEDIQNKLAKLHTTDIQNLKDRQDNQVKMLNDQINDLKRVIDLKQEEIENQIREKNNQRDAFNAKCDRLNSDIETQKLKYQVLEEDRKKDYDEATEALNRANSAHAEFSEQQRRQIQFLESEIEKLKQLLVHKNNEIDINIAQHRTIKNNLEEDIRQLKLDNGDLRKRLDQLEYSKNLQLEELRQKVVALDSNNSERTKKFEAQIDYLENELSRARDNLKIKTEETNSHQIHRNLLETENKKLNSEIDSLNNHMVMLEKLKAQEIQELRHKLENSNNYTIESIKASHNNQLEAMANEIEDLKNIIEMKDRQLGEKADQYQKLEKSLVDIQNNTDLSDYQMRISKLGAEVATTKNLYDVFVKTRQPSYGSGKKLMPNNSGVSPIKKVSQF
ncbi:hypothetical protein ABPG74_009438 [Tetrahymena malaccensis]